jgi:hypothetical protein
MARTAATQPFAMMVMLTICTMATSITCTRIMSTSMPSPSTPPIPCSAHRKCAAHTSMARPAGTKRCRMVTISITSWMEGCIIRTAIIATTTGRCGSPKLRIARFQMSALNARYRGARDPKIASTRWARAFYIIPQKWAGRCPCYEIGRCGIDSTFDPPRRCGVTTEPK